MDVAPFPARLHDVAAKHSLSQLAGATAIFTVHQVGHVKRPELIHGVPDELAKREVRVEILTGGRGNGNARGRLLERDSKYVAEHRQTLGGWRECHGRRCSYALHIVHYRLASHKYEPAVTSPFSICYIVMRVILILGDIDGMGGMG